MNSADATDSIPELYQLLASDTTTTPTTTATNGGSTSPSMVSDVVNATTTNSYDIEDTMGSRVSKRRRSTTSTSDTSRSAAAPPAMQATVKRDQVKPSRSTSPTALKQNVDQENERKANGRGNKRRTDRTATGKARVSASPQIAFKELPDGINTRRRGTQWRAGSPDMRQRSNETGDGQDIDAEDEQENESQGQQTRRRANIRTTSNKKNNGGSETRRRAGGGGKGTQTMPSPLSPNIDRHIPTKHSPLISHRDDMDMVKNLSPFEERHSDTESPRVRAKTPPTKIRYPSNKMSLGDMDKRASQILRYINRMQMTMTKKQRSGYHRQGSDDHSGHFASAMVDPVVISNKTRPVGECSNNSNGKLVGELEVASSVAPAPPMVLTRSLSISSMASSLSSASTIPLNEDESNNKSTSTHEQKNEDDEQEENCIPAPEHATALEIMNRLACELVKFQCRFGPQKNSNNPSILFHPDRSQQQQQQQDDRLTIGGL